MNMKFKDIKPGMHAAKVAEIKEGRGPYGEFLRFNFTVVGGELKDWSFYGIVKPSSFRISKLYRWITVIMGGEPGEDFALQQLLGKECNILLQKKIKEGKTYYSVQDLL